MAQTYKLSTAGMHLQSHPQWSLSFTLGAWNIGTSFWLSKATPLLDAKTDVRCMSERPWNRPLWSVTFKLNHVSEWLPHTSIHEDIFFAFDYKSSKGNIDDQNIYPSVQEWFSSLPCMCVSCPSVLGFFSVCWGNPCGGNTDQVLWTWVRGMLMRKCFIGHAFYHLYPVVT